MSKINDGGSAYPCEGGEFSALYPDPGMSLRDRIAIEALGGMLAHATRYRPRDNEDRGKHWHDAIVSEALDIADAFLAARSRPEEDNG